MIKRITLNGTLILLLGTISLVFARCERHSDMQSEGAAFLHGVWVQDSIPGQDNMLNYALHEFKFVCDSVYTEMRVHEKTQRIPDSCYQAGQWSEYSKSVYVLRGDSIIVEGVYTREDGTQKISGCYRQGQFLPRYKVAYQSPDSLVLESKYDQRPITLRKVAEVDCVPKKRWEL